MELYFKCMQHRKRIFFSVVILNALLLCTWVIITNQERIRSTAGYDQQRDDIFHKHSAKQEQPLVRLTAHFHQHKDVIFNKNSPKQEKPRERSTGNYDQRRNDIFNKHSTFWLREVTINDIKQWQEKFYASLARVRERPPKTLLNTASNLAYDFYNQNLLDNFTQLKMPLNEPKQSVNVANGNGLVQFLEAASCKPISPDVVLYNRIFKTGSETTGALLNFIAVMMDYFYTKRKCFYKILS